MTFTQKILLMLAGILAPMMLLAAAAPSNVKHVQAKTENGKLTVNWDSAQDATGIDFYRVYYSHESILGHDGNYDDFERTAGPDTTYIFKTLPLKSKQIFVSVLAVNKSGVESEGFEAEASVDVPISSSSSSTSADMSASSSSATGTAEPMLVTSVNAASETGVVIAFSKPVSATTPVASTSFLIIDGSGVQLEVTSVDLSDATVLLHTGKQTSGKTYLLRLIQPVPAKDGTNAPTSVQPEHFNGFGTQTSSSSSSSFSSSSSSVSSSVESSASSTASLPYVRNPALGDPTLPADPTNLVLTPMLRKDGTYNVIARWMAGADPAHSLAAYVLATSNDGQRFSGDASVSAAQTAASYNRIPPGLFGVKVSSKDKSGQVSGGIRKVITLPQSGIGILGIAAVSGAITASRRRKMKK